MKFANELPDKQFLLLMLFDLNVHVFPPVILSILFLVPTFSLQESIKTKEYHQDKSLRPDIEHMLKTYLHILKQICINVA